MSINIAVCDDERTEIEYLTLLIKQWADMREVNVSVAAFLSAEDFLFHYVDSKNFDILLLDIQMKAQSGVELAKLIRKENDAAQIIFITGFPDFMQEGYEVSALHYLIKPIGGEKLFEVLDRARKNMGQVDKSLFLTVDGEMHRIPFSEIRFIEAQGHYIIIKTVSREYKAKVNLSEIQKSLDNGFFRCQRSFIVNLKYIRRITRTSVVLDKATEIPLSRNLYEDVNQAVIDFFP